MIYGTQEFADRMKAVIKDDYRHPLYEQTVEHAKAMGVHIYGDKPVYLLDRARPREDEEVKAYRIENYEPTTKAGADKAIDIVGKIFNPMLYSIVFKDQTPDSELLQKYTLEYFPNYNSIVNFNKEVTLRKMLADPNGLMAIKPSEIPELDNQRIEPICVIYGSSAIWDYDREHYVVFLREENIERQTNYYFEYYDKNQYFEFYCWYDDPSKSIYFTEVTTPYNHNFNEIPAWFLRGKSKSIDNGMIIYESFFSSALPHWNQVVIHESDVIGAFLNHMHPISYEIVDECNYSFKYEGQGYSCRGGHIQYPGPRGTKIDMECPHCTGTGYKAVQSAYGKYQFSKQKLEDGNMPAGMMPVGFINVPTEATKLLIERCKDMNRAAMWAINMDVEDKVGESNSGVAKAIDRSAQWDTLYTIDTVVFDIHLPNQYYFINKYMFSIEARSMNKKEDKNLPSINKPTNFDILSTAERINNFAVAQKSGMDKNYLRIKSIEIANSDLSTNPDARKYLVAMLNLDPLYGFTQDEISLGVSNGVIRKVDWSVHENLKTFIDRAIKENPAFLELPKDEQIVILEKYGNELVAANKPKVDPNILQIDKQEDIAA
jgi:hypothetical protein